MKLVVIIIILFFCGCTSYRPRVLKTTFMGAEAVHQVTQSECDRLNTRVITWGGIAVGAGAVTSSNGIGIAASDLSNKTAKITLGSIIAGFSIVGAISAYVSHSYAQERDKVCEEVKP